MNIHVWILNYKPVPLPSQLEQKLGIEVVSVKNLSYQGSIVAVETSVLSYAVMVCK